VTESTSHLGLAIQAVGRIRSAFDIELNPRTLFERPTVAALGQGIKDAIVAELLAKVARSRAGGA